MNIMIIYIYIYICVCQNSDSSMLKKIGEFTHVSYSLWLPAWNILAKDDSECRNHQSPQRASTKMGITCIRSSRSSDAKPDVCSLGDGKYE